VPDDHRGELRPRAQRSGWREPRHIDADLGDDGGCGDRIDAGNLIEMDRHLGERGQLRFDLGVDRGDPGSSASIRDTMRDS
jgi:hypothetical protein